MASEEGRDFITKGRVDTAAKDLQDLGLSPEMAKTAAFVAIKAGDRWLAANGLAIMSPVP